MGKKTKLVTLVCGTQLGLTMLFSALLWGFKGENAAVSMFLGSMVGFLASLFMALKVFSPGVIPTATFLRLYYSGYMLKLVLVTTILALIFTYMRVDAFYLLIGLGITQIVYLIIMPFLKRL